MRKFARLAGGLLLAGGVLAGCSDSAGPTHERVIATLAATQSEPFFAVPDTVTQGVPFTVQVTSHGSSSCLRNPTLSAVQTAPTTVLLTAFIEREIEPVACTDDLHRFDHQTQLTLLVAGGWTLQIRGRAGSTGDTTIVRSVFVR